MSGINGQILVDSVLELFHFGPAPAVVKMAAPAPAPACSPPFVAEQQSFYKFHFSIYRGLFFFKERYKCFALLFQYFI